MAAIAPRRKFGAIAESVIATRSGGEADRGASSASDCRSYQQRTAAVRDLDREDVRSLEDDLLPLGAGQRVGVHALELALEVAFLCLDIEGGTDGQGLYVLPVGAGGRWSGSRWLGRLLGGRGQSRR
jgi:hypothetical protein